MSNNLPRERKSADSRDSDTHCGKTPTACRDEEARKRELRNGSQKKSKLDLSADDDRRIDEASRESFPASDPPAFNAGHS